MSGLTWRPHPVLKPPSEAEIARMAPDALVSLWETYHEAIDNAATDPYRYGWVLPHWEKAEEYFHKYRTLLVLGGNRSAKTEFSARAVVRSSFENEDSLIYCFSQNQETSVVVQQAAVYRYLPAELKRKSLGSVSYLSFTLQNGFSKNSLILPNRSRIIFKTYSQYSQDPTILEGMELGSRNAIYINIGIWCDEYLQGMEMLDRAYLRLATRNAKMLLTFTPKDGVTETVKYYCRGAKRVETKPAPLMQDIHGLVDYKVPVVEVNENRNTAIVYFHSINNPWGGYESIVEQCRSKNDQNYTLTAAYGVPTSTLASKFPCFSPEVNVLPPERMPAVGANCTRYMILDPAGRKNWFMAWVAVTPDGTWYVYREWPDLRIGEWAKESNGKWVAGEGSKGLGYGIGDYVRLIQDLEGKEAIYDRLIDPRMGAAKYQTQAGASSIIEELADAGLVFHPAPGLEIEDGLQALQSIMSYDRKRPIDGTNRPKFYISSKCENIIKALQEYTAEGGPEEIFKDCIDTIRYLAISGFGYVDPKWLKPQSVGRTGY